MLFKDGKYLILRFALLACIFYTNAGLSQPIWTDSAKMALYAQKPDTNKVFSLLALSEYYQLNSPDSALMYAKQALDLASVLNFETGKFWANVSCSNTLMIKGNYPLELAHVFESFSGAKKLNTPRPLAVANAMMCGYYYALGEYQTSLTYWNEVRRIIEQWFPDEMWGIWFNLSNIYAGLEKPDSAMMFAKNAYSELIRNKRLNTGDYESRKEVSSTYNLLGNRYADNRQYDSALYYLRRNLHESMTGSVSIQTIAGFNGLSNVYFAKGEIDSAIYFAEKVIRAQVARSYPVSLLEASTLLATIYDHQGKADSALKYEKLGHAWKDSLFNREKMITIRDITFREQEKRQQYETAKIHLRNKYWLFGISGLFIIIMVSLVVLLRFNKGRQVQKVRNSIADDLHDDIGSTLSSIRIMSVLAKDRPAESTTVLQSISDNAAQMQENLADIVWSVNSKNDRFEHISRRMNVFATEITEAKNINLDFYCDVKPSVSLSMAQRKNLYLFFKEAVNNMAKYSSASSAIIRICQSGKLIELVISDNGIGFDLLEGSQGNGMESLKKRATDLQAAFQVESEADRGTEVRLQFKCV